MSAQVGSIKASTWQLDPGLAKPLELTLMKTRPATA